MADKYNVAGEIPLQGDSYTFTVVDENGFGGLYTLREKKDEVDFLTRVKSESIALKEAKFVPKAKTEWKGDFGKPTVTVALPVKPYGGFKKQEVGETCNKCGVAKIVLNPNSGKTFCEDKCWLNKKY